MAFRSHVFLQENASQTPSHTLANRFRASASRTNVEEHEDKNAHERKNKKRAREKQKLVDSKHLKALLFEAA